MEQRVLAQRPVSAIGFGCMNIVGGYGPALSDAEAHRLLQSALDHGYTHFDTAAVYGAGESERLVGEALSHRRAAFYLASKAGFGRREDGTRCVDNSEANLRSQLEAGLKRLRTEAIDLYYLHRWDREVPIEEVVGLMSRFVEEGKVLALGLSEVSATTLERANATHPIAAIQSEYSLWTRNPEVAVLETAARLGIAFVAFSPVARGFLTGAVDQDRVYPAGDLRARMPRFHGDALSNNLQRLHAYCVIADEVGCTPAQLAIAWLLHKAPHILPIPGTQVAAHMEENIAAASVRLDDGVVARLEEIINTATIEGHRYTPEQQADIDTEDVPN